MSNAPEWMPWALAFLQFIIALLMMVGGMYLKNTHEEVKENTKKIEALTVQFLLAAAKSQAEVHGVEKKLLEYFTPLKDFKEVSGQVSEHEATLARLKTRDEMRWMQEGGRTKQG